MAYTVDQFLDIAFQQDYNFNENMAYCDGTLYPGQKLFILSYFRFVFFIIRGWWCSGFFRGWYCGGFFLASYAGGRDSIPVSASPREVSYGLCLRNLLRSTQPNDRETVI